MKNQVTPASPVTPPRMELVDITRLRPWGRNARTHSRKQIQEIAASIRAFGFTAPILADRCDRIIAGHGRVEAAKLAGLHEVPVLRLEHLSETELRAYVLADNRLAEKAGWDHDLLVTELQALEELDFDLSLTGFDAPDLDLMLDGDGRNDADPEADCMPDEHPEAPPVTRPGDLWLLERHRLLCGDARDPEAYSELMAGERAEVVFTDPPYNVPIDGHVCGLGSISHREFAMASGEMTEAGFTDFLRSCLANMAANSENGALHYVFMDWRHIFELLTAARTVYGKQVNMAVWDKGVGGMGSLYRSQHELVFVFRTGNTPYRNNVELGRHGRNRTNVWRYSGANSAAGNRADLALHPTVKPAAMVADAIRDCTKRGAIVLDPFAGSGTVFIAAEKTGRQAYGMEIDPLYVDTAIRRWQGYAHADAVHAASGETFSERERRAHAAARMEAVEETGHVR